MKKHSTISRSILSVAVLAVLCAPTFLAAQAPSPDPSRAAKSGPDANRGAKTTANSSAAIPRTPDGHPDLHGYWTNLSFTPMERPAKYQGREFLTEKEMQEVYRAGLK